MTPKRLSQRERALTIYFASAEEKQAFTKRAAEFGVTASFLGAVCLYRGMETGVLDQMADALTRDASILAAGPEVKSKKPRQRPRTKTKKS